MFVSWRKPIIENILVIISLQMSKYFHYAKDKYTTIIEIRMKYKMT